MSENKKTVEKYIDGFNKSDHAQILSCLTDDIVWTVFGGFRLSGKEAYDEEIENPAFTGSPKLTIVRMVEEDDVVMAELGSVRAGGEQCITGDLPRRVGERADPERRPERLGNRAVARVCGQRRQSAHQCARDRVSCLVEPREIGTLVAARETSGTRAEHGGRRRYRLRILRAGELECR